MDQWHPLPVTQNTEVRDDSEEVNQFDGWKLKLEYLII